MRLLGLTCGRTLGNCEILLKEAVMSALESVPSDVELIRLNDLEIKSCTGCDGCLNRMARGQEPACSIDDDDMVWLMERVAASDGVIVASPVYFLGVPGFFKTIVDRMIPYAALTVRRIKANIAAGSDVRKVAGLISVGGGRHHWAATNLSLMQGFTRPLMMSVVDMVELVDTPGKGQALLREDAMEYVRTLGRNVALSMGKESAVIEFLGRDRGVCPVCHANVIYPGRRFSVECAVCGAGGVIRDFGDEWVLEVAEESMRENHLTLEGRALHLQEIHDAKKEHRDNLDTITSMLGKYKSFGEFSNPPRAKS